MDPNGGGKARTYTEILEQLKTWFPSPASNPIMDGYFVHTVSRFMDQLDALKSAVPILGLGEERDYREILCMKSPEEVCSLEELSRMLTEYCRGVPVWGHPNAQVNVIPTPSIPSIIAFMAAAVCNPNMVSDEYSVRFAEAELETTAILSSIIGYDPERAGGVYTFGGTGTTLYGCRLAIEKLYEGRAMSEGIREDVKIVASAAAHYSRLNVAAWLGVGTRNVVDVPIHRNNDMSIEHLERYLKNAFEKGEKIAAIIATMGTTDAFGIDDLASIVEVRDRLAKEYGLDRPPHIHADAVIGWPWIMFKDYSFEENPLRFRTRTLRSIRDSLSRIKALHLADSMGIDFHKTGYAPYISSFFLCRNRDELALLSREPEEMPYMYQYGRYHPGFYTLETSRSGAGVLAGLANLRLFGKEGYRVLIGHDVEMAEMLRERLEPYPFIRVLNDYNYGSVTLFRLYPEPIDAEQGFDRELNDPTWGDRVVSGNRYNRAIYDIIHNRAMKGEGVLLSWTDAYRKADYQGGPPIAAIKSYIMSPWTDLAAVEMVVQELIEARAGVTG